jgi:hypothetical protein
MAFIWVGGSSWSIVRASPHFPSVLFFVFLFFIIPCALHFRSLFFFHFISFFTTRLSPLYYALSPRLQVCVSRNRRRGAAATRYVWRGV